MRLAASYVGPEEEHAGMDQIRVVLPRTLEGAGTTDVQVEVEGTLSNTRTLTFR